MYPIATSYTKLPHNTISRRSIATLFCLKLSLPLGHSSNNVLAFHTCSQHVYEPNTGKNAAVLRTHHSIEKFDSNFLKDQVCLSFERDYLRGVDTRYTRIQLMFMRWRNFLERRGHDHPIYCHIRFMRVQLYVYGIFQVGLVALLSVFRVLERPGNSADCVN